MLPTLINLDFFILYSYPLFMGLAWGAAYYFTISLIQKNGQDASRVFSLYMGTFIVSWLGAKLFFLVFSSNENLHKFASSENFWLGGGFVFYGGLIFGAIYYYFYSYRLKKFPVELSRYLVPGIILGHAIGRVGCFLAGCCYGRYCDLPWAVKMHDHYRHPVQLYEAAGLMLLFIFSLNWINSKLSTLNVVLRYAISYSVLRFIIEFFRGDELRGSLLNTGLSSSQVISLIILILSSICLLRKRSK